jgi:hypothetical protein
MFLILVKNINTANTIDIRRTKKNSTSGTEWGTALTSFRNTVITETQITVALQAQKFPKISTNLMMAE